MCSIFGIVDFEKKNKLKDQNLKELNKILKHRGPDDEGYYNDEFVSLAFNRLSILDLDKGNQPIIRDHIISIFNGEIYNYKEIRQELESFGYKFKSNSDSEIIASAFLKWGIKCVEKFNGMFAIAIYDKKNNKCYLIRDRLGIKPLYYSFQDGCLIFCSEIKGIINYPGFQKKININALASYLVFRYPIDNDSHFFKKISKLAPGSYIEINIFQKKIKHECYWEIPAIKNNYNLSEKDCLDKLEQLLSGSVKKQLISDVPLGIFLSGGLDSSLISSIAAKNITGKMKTFSVGFKDANYDETSKAKIVSNYIDSEHTEIFVDKENFISNLEKAIRVKNAPLSIPHEYPMYLLSKEMNKSVKVVLSGEGADEFFGGYSRVQNSPIDFIKANFFKQLSNFKIVNKVFAIDQDFNNNNIDYLEFFFKKYKWFSIDQVQDLFNKIDKNNFDINKIKEPWKATYNKYNQCNLYEKTFLLFQNHHLQCLLDRLDIMTMSNSIEARVPFLDHEIVEFINTVPFKYKIKWKSKFHKFKSLFSNNFIFSEKFYTNKYLLRKLSKKYLPKKITEEEKLGFPLPMNNWMKDEKIKDILRDKKTLQRDIYEESQLNNILNMNNLKDDPYDFEGKKIWMILNVELWIRNFIDEKI